MKKLLLKISQPFRTIIGLHYLAAFIYCLLVWPGETILFIIVEEKIRENWEVAIVVIATSILAFTAGSLVAYLLQCFFHLPDKSWAIVGFLLSIYFLGIFIEEDNQKPYIWLWKKCKSLFKKRNIIQVA